MLLLSSDDNHCGSPTPAFSQCAFYSVRSCQPWDRGGKPDLLPEKGYRTSSEGHGHLIGHQHFLPVGIPSSRELEVDNI